MHTGKRKWAANHQSETEEEEDEEKEEGFRKGRRLTTHEQEHRKWTRLACALDSILGRIVIIVFSRRLRNLGAKVGEFFKVLHICTKVKFY